MYSCVLDTTKKGPKTSSNNRHKVVNCRLGGKSEEGQRVLLLS